MKSHYSAKAASVSKWKRDEIYKEMKCLSLLPVQLEEKIKELNNEYDCVNDEATRCSKRYRSLLEKKHLYVNVPQKKRVWCPSKPLKK